MERDPQVKDPEPEEAAGWDAEEAEWAATKQERGLWETAYVPPVEPKGRMLGAPPALI